MADSNTVDRAMSGLGSTMMRAGAVLKRARQDFGKAHEPKQKVRTTAIACIAAIAVTCLLVYRWGEAGPLDYIELPSRDLRVNLLETNEARDPGIIIITIDEAALAYGDSWADQGNETAATERFAWPWPRHVHNKLIRYCREGGARAIVFDLTFKETGPNTNQVMLQRKVGDKLTRMWTFDKASDDLFALEATARDDVALALVLGGTARDHEVRDDLLPQYTRKIEGSGGQDLLLEVGSRYAPYRSAEVPFAALMDGWPSIAESGRRGDEKAEKLLTGFRTKANTDEFMLSSSRYRSILPLTEPEQRQGIAALGLVTGFNDVDGVQRRFDVAGTFEDQVYLCLPLEVWRIYVLSFAREAQSDAGRRAFSIRFPGLTVTDAGFECEGVTYDLKNKLVDVPVIVEGREARYLGRTMPLDESGRLELRYRNFLPVEENLDWPFLTEGQREGVRARNPDGKLFAIYPQVSAGDILRDWDMINENRYKEAETPRLTTLVADLEKQLAAAPEDERDAINTKLEETKQRLAAVRAQPVRELAFGTPADMFKDKIVLVSSTASVLIDRHRTPLANNTPGTWVLATYLDNLKNDDFMTSLPRWLEWLLALAGAAIAVIAVMYAGRLRYGLMLTMLLGVLVVVAAFAAFRAQLWFPIAVPLAGLFCGFLHGALAKALTEGHQRRQREQFARQYMGKELVDHVINNPGSLKLGGENRPMTMYFSDVAGFTTVTETLGPNNPERLVELLNIYLERMTDLMLGTGGVIDKYIGDAIMCFWGAPMAQEDHAMRACRGALACRVELQRMQPLFADSVRAIAPQLIEPDGSVLYARAGINSGIVTVGNMGSSKRFAYTVMGDAVNLAARLEPQCKGYGTDILIGEKTEAQVRGEFTLRRIDLIVVKGKTQPVQIFELIGDKDVPQFVKDLLAHFEKGIDLFRDRQFEAALQAFKNAAHHETEQDQDAINPSRLYIERCEQYLREPPPAEWNGVVIKKEK
jgi:class 3 adenylate cyclase